MNKEDLKVLMANPLEKKIQYAIGQIEHFAEACGSDKVYVAFSGGKDSIVLLDLVRSVLPDCPGVYNDSWMEHPDVRRLVAEYSNIVTLQPKKTMEEIAKLGWCFPSKEGAAIIQGVRRDAPWAKMRINGLNADGTVSVYRQRYKALWPIVDSDIPISPDCCYWLKKAPCSCYEQETGKNPFLGIRAEESSMRRNALLRDGCNTFRKQRAVSRPISCFTMGDIMAYIRRRGLTIPSAYGEIRRFTDGKRMQYALPFDAFGCLYPDDQLRTGCLMCPVACHRDGFSKFRYTRRHYPDIYEYMMEELGERRLVEWICRHYNLRYEA